MPDFTKQFEDYKFHFNCLQSIIDRLHKGYKIPTTDELIITIEQYMIHADNLIGTLDEAVAALEDDKK